MLGVQQIHKQGKLRQMVEGTKELGIPILKCRYNDEYVDEAISDPFFTKVFLWYRSDGNIFKDGMTQAQCEHEYNVTYNYVKNLLEKFDGQEKSFYLGNWEGDWYLLPGYNSKIHAVTTRVQGMIQWLNIRQQAVECARRDIQSTAKVFHYVELNRAYDAYAKGMERLVNKVLPFVVVDYVSVSSYDIQEKSTDEIDNVITYIERNTVFSNVQVPEERRVFIGEYALPAIRFGFDQARHSEENMKIYHKFKSLNMPWILYWNFYNNEYEDDKTPRGFWVRDEDDNPVQFFYDVKNLSQTESSCVRP